MKKLIRITAVALMLGFLFTLHPILLQGDYAPEEVEPGSRWPYAPRPEIRTRSDWGALPHMETLNSGEFMRDPEQTIRIVFHHTAGNNSVTDCLHYIAGRIRNIQYGHMNPRGAPTSGTGWSDIGYHFIICQLGYIWEGRDMQFTGAHLSGFNHNIGIAVLGNFAPRYTLGNQPANELTEPQIEAMIAMSKWLIYTYDMEYIPPTRRPGFPSYREGNAAAPITTHRSIGRSACPGANAGQFIENDLRALINEWGRSS